MSNVVTICQPKGIFTLDEANALVPLLTRITERHQGRAEELLEQHRYFLKCGAKDAKVKALEDEVNREYVQWGAKLHKLGATVLPNGFLGFDFGCGYWSWHYPEQQIQFYHGYHDAPHSRRPMTLITGPVL